MAPAHNGVGHPLSVQPKSSFWGAVMAYNVLAVNEPARAGRQHGEAGSRPFPSYLFPGLPGQRAKRASVNPACYLMRELLVA